MKKTISLTIPDSVNTEQAIQSIKDLRGVYNVFVIEGRHIQVSYRKGACTPQVIALTIFSNLKKAS